MKKSILLCLSLALMLLLIRVGMTIGGPGNPGKGKRIYDQYCAPCHGKFGKGDGTRVTVEQLDPLPRNHTDASYMNQRTDVQLFKVDKEGGFSMNLSHIMPSWGHVLTDEDVWDVVAYVRTLAETPSEPQGGAASPSENQSNN